MGAPGCDDAPLVSVLETSERKPLTVVYPYYENPVFLAKQIENWESWPVDLRSMVRIIVVDDGSPERPASEVLRHWPHARLFRIGVDVRWNWLAARNVGAYHADDGWLVTTDMDHVIDRQALTALVYGQHDKRIIYRFSRREHTGQEIHPHPNSWFYTRSMYWAIGGYDEALSGYYGTDGEYRRRCARTAGVRIMKNCVLERHERLGDSSTIRYLRKQPEDAAVKKMIRARGPGWRPRTLSFPYEEITL